MMRLDANDQMGAKRIAVLIYRLPANVVIAVVAVFPQQQGIGRKRAHGKGILVGPPTANGGTAAKSVRSTASLTKR